MEVGQGQNWGCSAKEKNNNNRYSYEFSIVTLIYSIAMKIGFDLNK
jgi:hypothetical protein